MMLILHGKTDTNVDLKSKWNRLGLPTPEEYTIKNIFTFIIDSNDKVS